MSRDLTFETCGKQCLLPRPRHRAVIRSPPELVLSRGVGERRIRDEQSCVGQQACRERTQHGVDELLDDVRRRILQQQCEAAVRVQDRNRLVLRIERDRTHDQVAAGQRIECWRCIHAELRCIGSDLPTRVCLTDSHAKHRGRVARPHIGDIACVRQGLALFRRQVRFEQPAEHELLDRAHRSRNECHVHIEWIAPARESILTVAPLPVAQPRLQRNQVRRLRRLPERACGLRDPGEISDQRRADGFAIRHPPRQKCLRAGTALVVIEQVRCGDRRQHEIVVDHVVVVDRRIAHAFTLPAMTQDGELADIFLVRHFTVRRQPLQHCRESALQRLRRERR
jgi:hypothetical protein